MHIVIGATEKGEKKKGKIKKQRNRRGGLTHHLGSSPKCKTCHNMYVYKYMSKLENRPTCMKIRTVQLYVKNINMYIYIYVYNIYLYI